MRSTLLITTFLLSFSAMAQVQLGTPTYGGNGCLPGSVETMLSPDAKTMSVFFDQFKAEAGRTTGRRLDRSSCNLRIPIKIPVGYSVAVQKANYRGFTTLATGASATFNAEYFYVGSKGMRTTKKFRGPVTKEFIVSNKSATQVWSPCGKDVILGVNASATAIADATMRPAVMIVDTSRLTTGDTGLMYSLNIKRCN